MGIALVFEGSLFDKFRFNARGTVYLFIVERFFGRLEIKYFPNLGDSAYEEEALADHDSELPSGKEFCIQCISF